MSTERATSREGGNVVALRPRPPDCGGTPPFPPGPAQVVADLLARRPGSSDALYDLVGQAVVRTARKMLGPDDAIDDVVHDIFVEILRSVGGLRDRSLLTSWCVGVAVRCVRREIRRRSRRRLLFFGEPPPDVTGPVDGDSAAVARRFYAVLASFPADEQTFLTLRFVAGWELLEIAAATGASLSTVKRRLESGRARLLLRAGRDAILSAVVPTPPPEEVQP